ncbi:MAG TPA: hypothetical protein VHI51_15960 [Ktedonobacterales bacterium]|nr:hypothetical protein [Ktedonobacterales bacterium]
MSGMTHLLRNFGDDISVRRARALRRMLILFTVFKVSAFIVVGALAWLAIQQLATGALDHGGVSVQSEVVGSAFNALFILQIMDFTVGTGLGPLNWGQASRAFARTLTNIVAARDLRLALDLPVPPTPGADGGAAERAQVIGPLSHPMRALGLSSGVYIVGALGGVAMMGMGVFMISITLFDPSPFRPQLTLANEFVGLLFPLCVFTIGVGGIIVALVTRHFVRLERLPLMAHLDSGGVAFTRAGDAGSTQRLAWGDVRGLARLAYTDEMGWMHEVFALSGPQQDYLWEALFAVQSAPGSDEEASRVAGHLLVEEIMRRTGLPLLDLTGTMYVVMAASNTASGYPLSGFFARARKLAKRRGDTSLMRAIEQHEAHSGWLLGRFAGRQVGGVERLSPQKQAETLRLASDLLPYYPTPAQLAKGPGGWRFAGAYVLSQFAFQVLIVVLAFASVAAFNPL